MDFRNQTRPALSARMSLVARPAIRFRKTVPPVFLFQLGNRSSLLCAQNLRPQPAARSPRGPETFLTASGLALDEIRRAQNQPPGAWRRHSLRTRRPSAQQKSAFRLFQRARNHPIRNLFGADFEQEAQASLLLLHPCARPCPPPVLRNPARSPPHAAPSTLIAPRESSVFKQVRAFQPRAHRPANNGKAGPSAPILGNRSRQAPRFLFVQIEQLPQRVDIRHFRSCRPNSAARR